MLEQPVEVYDILVVLYQAGEQVVRVRKGPNKGEKIEYVNVVKAVMKIGEWQGGNLSLALPAFEVRYDTRGRSCCVSSERGLRS